MSLTMAETRRRAGRPDYPYRFIRSQGRQPLPVALYDTALTQAAYGYGQPQHLGDLFNDVMGAVIPGWDSRPDWMKKIQIKADPAKLMTAAAKVVPPSMVGRVVDQASNQGFNLFYRTPAGNMPITGRTAETVYSNYGAFAQAQQTMENIPTWVYVAGGGLLLFLLVGMRRK